MPYRYFDPDTRREVSLPPKSSFLKRLFCEHSWKPLVREEPDQLFHNLRGDKIQYVCIRCGKLGEEDFWEFEGSGYK